MVKKEKDEYKEISKEFKLPKNKWKTFTIALIIILAISIFTGGFGIKEGGISNSEAEQIVSDYIEDLTGQKPIVSDSQKTSGVVMQISVSGQQFMSFLSGDGEKLFPSAIDLEQTVPTIQPPAQNLPKTNKPKVELFVMSHCPFGTQIEKGIISVIETLKDKINFNLKFCDYAMHGEKELQEQLTQHCVQKQGKITDYLKCFLADETKSDACIQELGIDKAKLQTCIEETDTQFKVMESFNDRSTWLNDRFPIFDVFKQDVTKYRVQGSPTLIINGVQANSARDPQSLLTTVCGAFETAPEECEEELSSTQPSPGFGFSTTGATTASAAQCA